MKRVLPLAAAMLVIAGCGGSNTSAPAVSTPSAIGSTRATSTTPAATVRLELFYLADDGKLVAEPGEVPATLAVASAALHALATAAPGTTTEVPDGLSVAIAKGDAKVIGAALSKAALAQVVYTLTEFPTVQTVNGRSRQDVEDFRFVPAILVEHPLPDWQVSSPLHVSGTADTFEATFEYELKDSAGVVLAKGFTTASSGNGTRGTFAFSVPFTVDHAQDGTLVVYESSAADGSRIHVREIPLRLV
jgi:Immunoglobulin-like domain of bacterial spore germination/Sporulation and spore germination